MAFWKKSEDPWDRKPERKPMETVWRETEPAEEKDVPMEEKSVENVENSPKTGKNCLWCGEIMRVGSICSRRNGAWRKKGD